MICLASGGFVQTSLADEEAEALEAQVKSSADAYNDAISRQEELTAEIATLDARIAELEAKLPAQRERSDESIRALYKYEYDSSSVLMMLLESTSVTDMLAIVDSYNWIIEYNTTEIQSAIQMESELKNAREKLANDKANVDKAAQDALDSLQQAREARERVAARAGRCSGCRATGKPVRHQFGFGERRRETGRERGEQRGIIGQRLACGLVGG